MKGGRRLWKEKIGLAGGRGGIDMLVLAELAFEGLSSSSRSKGGRGYGGRGAPHSSVSLIYLSNAVTKQQQAVI